MPKEYDKDKTLLKREYKCIADIMCCKTGHWSGHPKKRPCNLCVVGPSGYGMRVRKSTGCPCIGQTCAGCTFIREVENENKVKISDRKDIMLSMDTLRTTPVSASVQGLAIDGIQSIKMKFSINAKAKIQGVTIPLRTSLEFHTTAAPSVIQALYNASSEQRYIAIELTDEEG